MCTITTLFLTLKSLTLAVVGLDGSLKLLDLLNDSSSSSTGSVCAIISISLLSSGFDNNCFDLYLNVKSLV